MLGLNGDTGARYGLMLIGLAAKNSAKANNAQGQPDCSDCSEDASSPSSQSVTISLTDAQLGGSAMPLEEFLDLWKPEQRGTSHDRTLIASPC